MTLFEEKTVRRLTRDQIIHHPTPLLSDGAMGTLLHQKGVGFDVCFDELNLIDPALVGEIHREYIDAGSQIIQTNTFGANRYKLGRYGLADKMREINQAGVELARRVILGSFKNILIAGDVGPLVCVWLHSVGSNRKTHWKPLQNKSRPLSHPGRHDPN
jgi:homocysteine S-methyltransferase